MKNVNDEIVKIADRVWPLMMRTIDEKGADFAFDVLVDALKEAYTLND